MRPLDNVEASLTERLEGNVAHVTGVEIAVLIPMIMDMVISLIGACRGDAAKGIKEESSLRRSVARRIVNKSLRKSGQKVSRGVKEKMVDSLLIEANETTIDDINQIVDEVNTIDWGSL